MIIEKILNNNVLITVDPKTRREKILMGSGLGFKKKVGQEVDEDKIEKIFIMDNLNDSDKFKKLIQEIPIEIMQITGDIVKRAEEELKCTLDDHIYVALSDHIAFSIKRLANDIVVKNNLLVEIKRVHRKEFEIGQWAVNYINEKLKVSLPLDEAGFISLHIVNASYTDNIGESYILTNVVRDVLNIIRYNFSIEFIEDDLNYDRLLTHLKFFAKRIVTSEKDLKTDNEFIDMIRQKYKEAYKCSLKIKSFVESKYNYNVAEDELVYLSLHIHRVINVIKSKIR
ncbi:PRD domain-containing protein [Clostridium sp. YIM B02505]|uniref:PRD domain-containing protein n=1 Tax=Clostridium yunnanense TaxID=2800325 RepID=A0ABS1ELN6_9CLOT|nr:PRD domain-containing protein [Clostridium yunnanense]MBK1810267.1 PRD domain-containing protein [Clostridium yunnanense]